jgi:hypothetical protein
MAQFHIFAFNEDALILNGGRGDDLKIAIGEAVIDLASGEPVVNASAPSLEAARSRAVLNGPGVHWAGDVHSTESSVFLWDNRRLKPWYEASLEELEQASEKIAQVIRDKRG